MSGVLIFIYILLILLAIVLIVSVLMQEGNRAGLGAIGGGAETFLGKQKAQGIQGKLELITKIAAGAFIALAIVATILTARQGTPAPISIEGATINEDGTITIDPSLLEDMPVETAAPETTDAPEATTAPEATEAPAETAAPEATAIPEATAVPEATPAA